MHLRDAYRAGVSYALTKFALAAPTPADAFAAGVDDAKPMDPPAALLPPPPAEPEASNPHAPYDLTNA